MMKKRLLTILFTLLLNLNMSQMTIAQTNTANSAQYSGTWLRIDDPEFAEQKIEIQQINNTEFKVQLTKYRPQSKRYNANTEKTITTKSFTATLNNGALLIDNGGMEVTTLRYNPKNQTLETTLSWSFPEGVFEQEGRKIDGENAQPKLPTYKAKKIIEEGLALASSAKVAIVEYYANYGEYPTNNDQAGIAKPEYIHVKGVKSVSIMPQGQIVISYTELINPQAQPSITLTANLLQESQTITWSCTAQNIVPELLPNECKP